MTFHLLNLCLLLGAYPFLRKTLTLTISYKCHRPPLKALPMRHIPRQHSQVLATPPLRANLDHAILASYVASSMKISLHSRKNLPVAFHKIVG